MLTVLYLFPFIVYLRYIMFSYIKLIIFCTLPLLYFYQKIFHDNPTSQCANYGALSKFGEISESTANNNDCRFRSRPNILATVANY